MIGIVDYGAGNLGSLKNAFDRLRLSSFIAVDQRRLKEAKMLVLPGVGAAGEGMRQLNKRNLSKLITKHISQGRPFLGICLGMQLLFEKSEEGNTRCLGVLKGKVVKFKKERKVPQIGWNEVKSQNKKLFHNIPDKSFFYFVNSYYCVSHDKSIAAAVTDYGEQFVSVVVKNNIIATQFHPEKSGHLGQQLLKNILAYFYAD